MPVSISSSVKWDDGNCLPTKLSSWEDYLRQYTLKCQMFMKTIKHYKMSGIVIATFPVNFLMR